MFFFGQRARQVLTVGPNIPSRVHDHRSTFDKDRNLDTDPSVVEDRAGGQNYSRDPQAALLSDDRTIYTIADR